MVVTDTYGASRRPPPKMSRKDRHPMPTQGPYLSTGVSYSTVPRTMPAAVNLDFATTHPLGNLPQQQYAASPSASYRGDRHGNANTWVEDSNNYHPGDDDYQYNVQPFLDTSYDTSDVMFAQSMMPQSSSVDTYGPYTDSAGFGQLADINCMVNEMSLANNLGQNAFVNTDLLCNSGSSASHGLFGLPSPPDSVEYDAVGSTSPCLPSFSGLPPAAVGRYEALPPGQLDPSVCEDLGPPRLQRHSGTKPRTLRPSSDRREDYYARMSHSNTRESKDSSHDVNKPRSDRRYDAKPGKNGEYRCPFASAEHCQHKPTKQKCIYAKYLDSHLKPYKCKDPSCQDICFSSNACLFRHEREAHGQHGHGENPYRCLWTNCERSHEGMGFPRLWNLGDHTKRVHGYNMTKDDYNLAQAADDRQGGYETARKRRAPNSSGSVQMKRTSSVKTKAQIASPSYSRDGHARPSATRSSPQGPHRSSRPGQSPQYVEPYRYSLPVDEVQYARVDGYAQSSGSSTPYLGNYLAVY